MTRKSYTIEGVPEKRIQVSPSKSFDLSATFWDEWTGNEKNEIQCTFRLFHTYKAETVTYVSVSNSKR